MNKLKQIFILIYEPFLTFFLLILFHMFFFNFTKDARELLNIPINYFIAKISLHGIDVTNINKWINSTNIIRTAKSAGRHYKIYKETQNQESLTRHTVALEMLIELLPQLKSFF